MTAQNIYSSSSRSLRVLVTGAGGPAAIGLIRDVAGADITLIAADADPLAAGLYLLPPSQRVVIPMGKAPEFVEALLRVCVDYAVDVLVPTCDAELLPLARAQSAFAKIGVILATSSHGSLDACLDKYTLYRHCESLVPAPKTRILADLGDWTPSLPVIIKPRRGSGSRGVRLIRTAEQWRRLSPDAQMICQEYLPGQEYSVDCFALPSGRVIAAVPRERMRVDSGVAMVSRTVKDPQLQALAVKVVEAMGLQYAVNVQFRRAADGTPKLLEVNPRLAGTMRLTTVAGLNLPWFTIKAASGAAEWLQHLPPGLLPFSEKIIVRTLQEHTISMREIDLLRSSPRSERKARPPEAPLEQVLL